MKYQFKLTLKKFFIIGLEIGLLGGIAFLTDSPEYMFLIPVLEAVRNAWKHRNK